MINHHQNININICYNMQSQKNNKNITGKKIQKIIKTSSISNCFNPTESKHLKKNNQNNLKKANQLKNLTENKKNSKKKNLSIVRNIQTPDLFMDRRLKTQGGIAQTENCSTFKKEHKKPQFKSTHPAFFKNNLSVKKQKNSKNSKNIKQNHIKSCDMYGGWKRINTQENILPQSMNSISKKKRAHSAILRNDKVVSRLLNISLLNSQLGGSQPITSQRAGSILNYSKSFKQCMTSIDMRIIRNIQDDMPCFEKKESKSNQIIKLIMRRKGISLQQLTKKVIIVQRTWRMKKKTSIIDIYKKLFIKATNNLHKQNILDNVSIISRQFENSDSESHFQIFNNQNLALSLKKSGQNSRKNSKERSQEEDEQLYPLRWIQQSQKVQQFQEDELNFKKYKELVKEQIISLNKKIPIQNKKLGLDSKLLIDELIKQNFNKKWIQDQSQSNSGRKIRINQNNNNRSYIIPEQDNEQDNSDFNKNSIETFPKRSKHEEDDSFDDSQVYNYKKYTMNGQETTQQTHVKVSLNQINSINSIKINQKKQWDKSNQKEELKIDQQWINNQIRNDNNNIVRSYLDCGLDNFSLQIKKLTDEKCTIQNDKIQGQKQQNYSSDEAIGVRFQRANLGILRKNSKQDIQPIALINTQKMMEETIEEMVNILIEFLINEFSSDISLILRKSVNPAPVPKHPIGIQTNYNSIKLYIANFIQYASKNSDILNKVTQNINKDIAPSSLEILTYLRPQQDDEDQMNAIENQELNDEDEDGLFVVPAEMFEEYQNYLEAELQKTQQREVGPRVKAYLSFWHRAIFQSYNQCLDYQRPYGIEGKPYQWVKQMKIHRSIQRKDIIGSLHKAQSKMLQLSTIVCGIIFQKPDSPFEGMDFNEDQMHMMNEQRLSRVLANELLQNQSSWINYNDELAELLVQLSRMIQQKLFFEQGSEIKKLYRRRKLVASQSLIEKGMQFNIDELE